MLSLKKKSNKTNIEEILKICEIPLFMLKKKQNSSRNIQKSLGLVRYVSEEELGKFEVIL